jgi:hypothetical protein
MFISVDTSVRARHGKIGYCLGRRKTLFLEKTIMHPFVATPKSVFLLKQKRKYEYPLLTTANDHSSKYVGSLSNSNVLKYDPFKKLPTKKLAAHFLNKLNPNQVSAQRVGCNNIKNRRYSNGQPKRLPSISPIVKQRTFKNTSIRINKKNKKSSKQHGNPFQKHHLSAESRWLLRRLPI